MIGSENYQTHISLTKIIYRADYITIQQTQEGWKVSKTATTSPYASDTLDKPKESS
ncbi:hypothetical protein [Sphingobacterium tabacisoli]|uniref:Uncharacterized protein n=1 Tax=Sphingobacterium tabacisoli TaxID=2044855 RepID=A0ABW5L2I8_9SPHI|nr:hypothetical protein [Sphingobacterium tabacisoli]